MIKPFINKIPTWIVRCGHRLLDVMHGVQIGDDVIFQALALVTVNVGQNPTDVNHLLTKILAMVSAFSL